MPMKLFKKKEKTTPSEMPRDMFDRPFWRFFGRLADFFLLTVYWLLTSLPVVTIGASTTAVFYVTLKMARREKIRIWPVYISSFKENLKQGVFAWLLYVFIALDAYLIGYTMIKLGKCPPDAFSQGGQYFVPMIVLAAILLGVMIYTFALLATFRQTNKQLFAAAIGMTFSEILSTLLFLVIPCALGLFTFYIFPALILIDVPLSCYLISLRMTRIFSKTLEKIEKKKKQEQGITTILNDADASVEFNEDYDFNESAEFSETAAFNESNDADDPTDSN